MVEGADVQPGLRRVTGEALPGESQGHVIDVLGGLEVFPVACETVRWQRAECSPLIIGVATLAAELKVSAIKGKPGRLVNSKTRDVFEGSRGVAKGAVGGQGSRVHVHVASAALLPRSSSILEVKVFVA